MASPDRNELSFNKSMVARWLHVASLILGSSLLPGNDLLPEDIKPLLVPGTRTNVVMLPMERNFSEI